MKVYIVHYGSEEGIDIVRIFKELSEANDYARRYMSDTWQVQDGYPYHTIVEEDGTISYDMGTSFSYYTQCYEVE